MNYSQLKISAVRASILLAGTAVFLVSLRHIKLGSLPTALVFVLIIAALHLFDVTVPPVERVNFESAFIIAAMLLFPISYSVSVAVAGLLSASLLRTDKSADGGPLYQVAYQVLTVYIAGIWLKGYYLTAAGGHRLNFFSWQAVLVLGAVLTYSCLEIMFREIDNTLVNGAPFLVSFLSSLQFLGSMYAALISIGVLTAMTYTSLGLYSLAIFTVLLVVVRYSFTLFLDIRDTYRHTIAALSRVIEVDNPHKLSHSERVADLATDIAVEMRLIGKRLESVSYAALLHDIGKLGLEAGSFDAYLDTDGLTQRQIPHALIGAEILEQVKFLKPYARIVARHHLPFDPNRRNLDVEHPVEARIIAVANYYDQLTMGREPLQRLTPNQAVAKIKKDAFSFDPKAVRSLIKVLKKRNKLIVTD